LRIASDFRKALEGFPRDVLNKAQSIEARLFGSLSATGKGHRTDRAILAGLLGQKPETCDTNLMDELQHSANKYRTTINGMTFELSKDTIVWDKTSHSYPFANTMIMRLIGREGATLFEREYYSCSFDKSMQRCRNCSGSSSAGTGVRRTRKA
jgi:L-serine dehydratase